MSDNHDKPDSTDELRDRLLDVALHERVGGQSPPDLAQRILEASEMVPTRPANDESTKPAPPRSRRHWYVLAVAATLLVCVTAALQLNQRANESAGIAQFDGVDHGVVVETGKNASGKEIGLQALSNDAGKPVELVPTESLSRSGEAALGTAVVDRPESQMLGDKSASYAFQPVSEAQPLPPSGAHQFGSGQFGTAPEPASPRYARRTARGRDGRGFGGDFDVQFRQNNFEIEDQLGGPLPADEFGEGPGNSGDKYERIHENPFYEAVGERSVSTFSIDVDRASYANVRQFLMQSNRLPPPDAVRIEELINYFDYAYTPPDAKSLEPFAAHVEVAGCPWEPKHRLVRIGIKGRELDADKRPVSNLVFLIDVSGSMNQPNKLPLVVDGMKALTRQLGENDRVAIVVYASSEGLVLPSTPGTEQATILGALDQLRAGGSTAGGAGIQLAYQIAEDNFIEGGVNRVILCTDGDFNVGTTSTADLERMVQQKAKDTSVFLSVLGFGRGNLNDAMMETISNRGNGNYHYVDTQNESHRVLVEEMTGMLVTIAKDVKIQVFFNPAKVAGYRLIGYENRMLRTQDFNDDTKDAGEIGAGHTVTALYEIVPAGEKVAAPTVDESPYVQAAALKSGAAESNELLTLRMRYKQPDGDTSTLREWPVTDGGEAFGQASGEFKFAAAVAGFGMLLRDSEHKGNATWEAVLEIANDGLGDDPHGHREEFLALVRRAKELSGQ